MQLTNLKNMSLSEQGFLFDPVTGLTYTLNKTGVLVFKSLEQSKSVQEIADALAGKYEVNKDEVFTDVNEFILLLKEYGLLKE